ncbi:hypothetical protein M2352_003315 [Azospirillum fermentarium]|uniref:OpgC family protein n=1 Tax=Azospirillum fermentarium TaxID=1233114 RepID=UPI00222702CE|nr:OpgC domain-containing protein [Azospirillum fermentarium]MCW2247681.1 hypothetical protein [Azospirillum fermentarium]
MSKGRDGRVDLFRGLALIFIFWDHIPGNVLGQVSPRNAGLSDAAEIFVFLAGYGATLAYGGVMERHGYGAAAMRILKRAWVLYIAHIFLMVLLMGVVVFANARVETRDFIQDMHLGYFVSQTEQALLDALTLRFKPHLMDPLPLYILLLLLLAVIVPFLRRWRLAVLGASAMLYGLTQVFGWNMPDQGGGRWFFNPLAWQFLFVLGCVTAWRPAGAGARWWRARPVVRAAAVYLAASALLALSWRWPELHDAVMPRAVAELIYPISKTDLAPLRLLHFLALAVWVTALVPDGPWLDHPAAAHLRRMGRHSLEVFCLTVVLAPLADMVNTLSGDRAAVQLLTGLGGVAAMAAFALWIGWSRTLTAPAARPVREAAAR